MQYMLRSWRLDDCASVAKHAINPAITRFMSDGFPDTVDKWESFLRFAVENTEILYRAIDVEGQAVGGIGVSPLKDDNRKSAELGYWLSEEYWGRGVMTRAVRETVGCAFAESDLTRICAAPFVTNVASHRVLEKVGFTLESTAEKTIVKQGVVVNQLVYSVKRSSWPGCRR